MASVAAPGVTPTARPAGSRHDCNCALKRGWRYEFVTPCNMTFARGFARSRAWAGWGVRFAGDRWFEPGARLGWSEKRGAVGLMRGNRFRRAPRQPAGWFGKYQVVTGEEWYACRVINVSTSGVSLELLGRPASVGDRLRVGLLTPRPDIIRHPLHVVVRRTAAGVEGGVIIGAEYTQLDEAAAAFVTEMIEQQSRQGIV